MVVLNRIYTRSGDDGTTALGSGERRKKYDLRIDAYGTLDEVNAVVGLVRSVALSVAMSVAPGTLRAARTCWTLEPLRSSRPA